MQQESSILNTAIDAAKAAGELMQRAAGRLSSLTVEQKQLHDYVSEVDRDCEALIASKVRQKFPDHAFLGEETGLSDVDSAEYRWVVDPLDGTTNYLRAIPHYAVSIAVFKSHSLDCGVIYDPAKDELFTAQQGQGALLNGEVISVSQRAEFSGALLSTGVPFSGRNLEEIDAFSATMQSLLAKQTSGIRRLGSAALDLAYVAAGRYDGYWEANLNIWDIAAGVLLVQEAGGLVADLHGGQGYKESGDIVAASPQLMDDMIAVTKQHYLR